MITGRDMLIGAGLVAALLLAAPAAGAQEVSGETVTAAVQPPAPAMQEVSGETVTAAVHTPAPAAEEAPKPPEPIEALFVRPFTSIGTGRNDGNPQWSRSGMFLTFERSIGDKKEIRIALADGTVFQTVYFLRSAGGEMKFFFPGVVEDISYNAGISWSPDEGRFVFMGNAGEGNYDLYLGETGGSEVTRLTDHKEKDGQPDWSPKDDRIVFVSGRTGKGDLYLLDVVTRALTRLTRGGKEYLYPRWSPDGTRIAFMHGKNENHDIFVIVDPARPTEARRALTTWTFDDIRPVWSPDGKKIAFYSNYNPAGDPRTWSILVVAADGTDPTEGDGLAAKTVAVDVVPDVEQGPAWMPDSTRIVYIRNDRGDYHPIYVANLKDRTNRLFRTETKMNHDIACSPDGTIAFRAQVDQWDQIFTARMKEPPADAAAGSAQH